MVFFLEVLFFETEHPSELNSRELLNGKRVRLHLLYLRHHHLSRAIIKASFIVKLVDILSGFMSIG